MKKLVEFFAILESYNKYVNIKHISFWGVFICYELLIISLLNSKPFPVSNYVISYGINIILFYVHFNLMGAVMRSESYKSLALIALFLLEASLYLCIRIGIDYIESNNFKFLDNLKSYTTLHIWRGLYFMGFATLYWFFKRYIAIQKENHEIEKAKLLLAQEKTELVLNLEQTKNAFLVQQMNPHLLFNGLNFIYNSNPSESPSSKSILLLSDMMRYAVDISDHEQEVLLSEEIKQVQNMVALNALLIGEEMNLKVNILDKETNLKLIPLILMTFTENLFKHANLRSKEIANFLSINFDEHQLYYHSLNLKKPKVNFQKNRKSLGIKNAIQRLDYAYKDAYRLDIKDQNQTYELQLILPL